MPTNQITKWTESVQLALMYYKVWQIPAIETREGYDPDQQSPGWFSHSATFVLLRIGVSKLQSVSAGTTGLPVSFCSREDYLYNKQVIF